MFFSMTSSKDKQFSDFYGENCSCRCVAKFSTAGRETQIYNATKIKQEVAKQHFSPKNPMSNHQA